MPLDGPGAIGLASATRQAPPRVQLVPPQRLSVDVISHLRTVEGKVLYGAEAGAPVSLAPGNSYEVIVFLQSVTGGAARIAPSQGTELFATWEGEKVVRLSSEKYPFTAERFTDGYYPLVFTLDVPGDAPKCQGRLLLVYYEGSAAKSTHLLDVSIAGDYYTPPPELLAAAMIRLEGNRNPHLAWLHVESAGDELKVTGFHSGAGRFEGMIPQPDVSLADADDEQPSKKVYKTVLAYSRATIPKLLAWLDAVITESPDKLAIVIAEHADSRVPWEMLVLTAGDVPLGAKVVVTRWTAVLQNKDTRPLEVRDDTAKPPDETAKEGRVLKFIDSARLKHSTAEELALKECAHSSCESVSAVFELQPPDDVTLVFVACHGILAKDKAHEVELEDAANPSGKITTLDLEGLPEPVNRPVLVVNACHSARLVRSHKHISGLPAFFLSSFARSYLGTLGAIDEKAGAAIGAALLRDARRPEGVAIGEFLLKLRQRAVEEFKEKKKARPLVTSFMYVFYGSPWDRIRLKAHRND